MNFVNMNVMTFHYARLNVCSLIKALFSCTCIAYVLGLSNMTGQGLGDL